MFIKILFIVTVFGLAASRNVPRYTDLDEEEQLLFRAAYDSPYGHEEYHQYQVDEEVPINKLDLLKDGMWAIKAKIKQMKAVNKALAANLLSTKLQVKEMLANHLLALKKHQHVEINKPVYDYQAQKPDYPQYNSPAPHYNPPAPQYSPPAPQYIPPAPQYIPPAPQYSPPAPQHSPPAPQYSPHATAPQYGPLHYNHDPYYGH